MNFPWKKRDDLVIQPHDTGGWLVKDPVSLQYTLLSSLEYQVFQKLDGQSDIREVCAGGNTDSLTPQDIESFLIRLIKRQLLFRPAGGDSERFSVLQPKTTSPFAWLTRLLSWYVPLGNPRTLLSKLSWINTVVFRPSFAKLSIVIFATGMLVASLNLPRLVADVGHLARTFNSASVTSILVILVIVKLAHELGHALSARHYQTDCHEAGILFLLLAPVPFTNVTDSWRLPVAKRMVVTAAGIIVELWIACCCIILWSLASDGLTRALLLQTALICSINTLLFNGNPLLKFDGYFLLSDFLRIPNLSSRSTEVLQSICVSFVSGATSQATHEKENYKTLVTYGVLSGAYRLVLAASILEAIHFLCVSNDLRTFGWLLKLLTLTVLIGLPFAKLLIAAVAGSTTDPKFEAADIGKSTLVRNRRKGFTQTTLLAIAIGAICVTPLPSRVISVATITPSQQRIFAGVSGRISLVPVHGTTPELSQEWKLVRTESHAARLSIQAEVELAKLQLQIAQRTQRTRTGQSLQELEEAVESAENRLADFEQNTNRQSHLVDEPFQDIIQVHKFQPDSDGLFNEEWDGQPLSRRNLGAWIQQGTALGFSKSERAPIITAWVQQSDIQRIKVGQSVGFRLHAGNATTWQGIVEDIGRFPTESLPNNIVTLESLQGQPTEMGFRPEDTFFAVTVQLSESSKGGRLPLNGVGHARLRVQNRSLAGHFYNYLRQTFAF